MSVISILKKIVPRRLLYIQLLFTALAFLMMVFLGYLFMSRIVHNELIQNTENMLSFVGAQINSDLLEPRVTLSSFSQTVRNMIIRHDTEILPEYISEISNYRNSSPKEHNISGNSILFGYIEAVPNGPIFINGNNWEPANDYIPTERPWYQYAIAANGEVVETPPYIDSVTGKSVFAYVRSLLDDEGKLLGVVGLDVQISAIGQYIVETALAQGGYGMLLGKDLEMLAHPNNNYIGKYPVDIEPLIHLENDLKNGMAVSEHPMISYRNEASIAFFRQLPNGWYLGVVAPKGPYYETVNRMAITLGLLGAILAASLMLVLIRVDTARKKSDMESRYKSTFLANMSHEIRTPMNAIIGMTTIGKSSVGIERKDYCFSKIEDASNHLLGVINNILDMSKIEANKFELATIEFDFEHMLQRVINVVNFRMEEKQQKFKIHIDRDIPQTLIGDDQRLAQVITNLLGNAIKFTPEQGTITLDTRFLGEADGVCSIQISLIDTGIGITPEQQKRLFGSFEQAESSTARKFGGTGLGLSISKNIVELMGGKIGVKSEAGKGSTFFFTIQAKYGTKKEHLPDNNINWNNVRIMVVDDDQDILDYFNEITREFGIYCDTAISGKEALKFVEQNDIHHIYFIDWKMPDMDGLQLAAQLKAQTPVNTVVIMISAAELGTVTEEEKKAGVDKFLSKPLFPSSIADTISESLAQGQRKQIEAEQTHITGLFEGHRILLAEDVEINREIVLTLLEPSGLEIDCAENGMDAVRKFTESPQKYGMVFMDVQMPEMDGYEATRQIRGLDTEYAKNIPIIAMTANVFREDVEKSLNAGMNEHIGKPLNFNEVIAVLKKHLKI
jgi:signal transduction histidine kinase/CheY-like chemotaxis protein